jgi:hypothetical protein
LSLGSATLAFQFGFGVCQVFQTTAFVAEETIYDEYVDEFRRLIGLGRQLLKSKDLYETDEARRLYHIHVSLPLYIIACRSRDPLIRREALAIMEVCRNRDGVWSVGNMIQSVQYIMEIEEAAMDVNGWIPEAQRVRSHTATWMTHQDGLHFEVMQGPPYGEWVCRKAILNDSRYEPHIS